MCVQYKTFISKLLNALRIVGSFLRRGRCLHFLMQYAEHGFEVSYFRRLSWWWW